MNIVFTGHRDMTAPESALEQIVQRYPSAVWVHGGARGFDTQVQTFAEAHGLVQRVYITDYRRYGRPAPLIRNKAMLADADLVVACYDGRQRGGTYYTVAHARRMGIRVEILDSETADEVPR